ncbi:hypothetical protein KC19_9G145200 [Ceratodon purpureus]|uniref:Uncharacterized protein n=1 Tax=Ceratodon purpureus TaxID=3225 RepID=A0A8T0GRY2_CERPU|nr:hypothetical protein KC19_9G145200 [Ceratodon purpureus]
MHSRILSVLLLSFLIALSESPNSNAAVAGPASYLESGAPIVVINNASLPVDVRCQGGPRVPGADAHVAAGNTRSPRSTLKPKDHWSINLDPGTEDPLFCTFRSALRKWNCDERWLIKDACVWEKHRGSIVNPGHHVPPTPHCHHLPCPKCDSKNSVGKPICVWVVQNDGIHLQQWDPEKKQDVFNLTHAWKEDDPAFYDPTGPFRFSVANYFNNPVKIQCDVVSEPVLLEPSQAPQGPIPKWDYEIHPIIDAEHTYFTWTCDFDVLGTLLRRGGVQIWSPQPDVNTWVRTPDCTDCSWKLDAEGLWLDDRSCYTNRPVWVRQHLWDSVLNATSTDEIDWTPYYYPLKKSSHIHHVY